DLVLGIDAHRDIDRLTIEAGDRGRRQADELVEPFGLAGCEVTVERGRAEENRPGAEDRGGRRVDRDVERAGFVAGALVADLPGRVERVAPVERVGRSVERGPDQVG